jgi:O-acetyl-ADP-ribose deacetylase (regulator of RNase III)
MMMAFEIVSTPLLSLPAEAVVNCANSGLQYSAGLCGEIFDAAGKLPLQRACVALGECAVGSAVVTDGFGLSAKYIIHAVPPRWCGGKYGEDRLLSECYKSALTLAGRLGVRSLALPLLSEGLCGYPADRGLAVAKQTIADSPFPKQGTVYLTLEPHAVP